MLLPGKGLSWKQFLIDVKDEFLRDQLDDVAGMVAFSAVLALFPFLLFALALAGLVVSAEVAGSLVKAIEQFAPPQVASILGDRVHSLVENKSGGLLTLGALGAIWAGSSGVAALTRALNTAYGVQERRSWIRVRLLSIAVTLGGALFFVIASAFTFATPSIAHWIGGPIGTAVLWVRVPIAALVMMAAVALVYYLLPDVEQKFKFITPGAVLAVVLWLLASLGFSAYVQTSFGTYDVSYGAVGGVMVLLMWLWISSLAVLLGAEVNAVLEHRSPDGKKVGARSTTEPSADTTKSPKEQEMAGRTSKVERNVDAKASAASTASPGVAAVE